MTLITCLSVLFLANLAIFGQTGSISGTVVDATGSVIPNASVEVKGEGGQTFNVVTNSSGNYRVSGVSAGLYTVTATLEGFSRTVVSNVKVVIGTPTTSNIEMAAGDISEVVQVTSGGEVLQT